MKTKPFSCAARPSVIAHSDDGLTWFDLSLDHSIDAGREASLKVAVARHGVGPTALLIGRMHGDEAEGETALNDLLQRLKVSQLAGRLIIVPRANPPAAESGMRVAPDDGLDLNRVMPGRADGSVTERLAHVIATLLLPETEIVVDLHSGGRAFASVNLAWIAPPAEPVTRRKTIEAARAFGAPFTLVADGPGAKTLAAAAEGKLYIATDGPGAGLDTRASVLGMRDGVTRLLQHLGLLGGTRIETPPTRFVRVEPEWCNLLAPCNGDFAPLAEVGGNLAEGGVVGVVHPDRASATAVEIVAPSPSLLLGRAPAGAVTIGQRIAVLATDCPHSADG